jgi:asparagine synthetase B (glutamine-hydrolysing)
VKSTKQGARVRSIIESHLASKLGPKPRRVALLLSGGVDSTIVGLAAHNLGHQVVAYTFRVGARHSYDSKWAEKTAHTMGWEWVPVELPTSAQSIIRLWPEMHAMGCRKKRDFECTWPFMYVYPTIRERYVLNGLNADCFFGLGRKAVKLGAAGKDADPVAFNRLRVELNKFVCSRPIGDLDRDHNPSGMWFHAQLQEANDIVDVNPFVCQEMYDYLMRFTWQQLNMPRQKHFLHETYPAELELVGARNHQNYQKAGKIDVLFEKLLATGINFGGRNRTLEMFADWWRPTYAEQQQRVLRKIRGE